MQVCGVACGQGTSVLQPSSVSSPGGEVAGLRKELDSSKELLAVAGGAGNKAGDLGGAIAVDAKATLWRVALLSNGREIGDGVGVSARWALRAAVIDAKGVLPAANDVLQEAAQEKTIRGALLSVEASKARMSLKFGQFAEAEGLVRAGLEGLIVIPPRDAGKVAVVFPSEMLAMGQSVPQALLGAISQASGDAAFAMPGIQGHEAGDLIKDGWKFEKFQVEHRVELTRGGIAMTLTRGGRVIEERDVTLTELKRLRDGVRKHIRSRGRDIQNGVPRTIVSDYMPSLDRDGDPADVLQQTLAHWARNVSRGEDVISPFMVDDAPKDWDEYRAWALQDFAATAARVLCVFEKKKQVHAEPVGPDDLISTVSAANSTETERAKIDASVVREAFCLQHGWDASVPEPARGLVALALVRMLSEQQLKNETDEFGLQARGAVQSLLASGQPGSLVRYMPWLGWAAVELAPRERQIDGSLRWPDLACAPVLREMRGMIWEKQIDHATAQAEGPDLKGAILFGQGAEARRLIGWQTARPVAFIATMLRDPRLTSPEERNGEVVRLIAAMRFLRQLSIDESSAWHCPRADRAMYGVRNGPWDQRQSLEASVMTLLAVGEMIESLE